MLPDFIIAGIMKSGTSYLDTLIRNHPEIGMPDRSMDRSYFDNDEIYQKNDLSWYESLFEGIEGNVIGQTSADCAFNPDSINRIKKIIPNAKLVFVIRNPIDRAYSLFWHQVSMGRECNSFEKAIEVEDNKTKKSYYHLKMYSYVNRSRYKSQFNNIFRIFDENDVFIIPFDALIKDKVNTLNKLFDFLNVSGINDLNELMLDPVKQNKAKIPTSKFVIYITYFLQSIGLFRLGRVFMNRYRFDVRPPKMDENTRKKLEYTLSEDVEFYNTILNNF